MDDGFIGIFDAQGRAIAHGVVIVLDQLVEVVPQAGQAQGTVIVIFDRTAIATDDFAQLAIGVVFKGRGTARAGD
ncbi:hypothetical protein D3C80_2159300 [compost metagenome]